MLQTIPWTEINTTVNTKGAELLRSLGMNEGGKSDRHIKIWKGKYT